ncbi:winged helix-turn-helix transcriptional regulator [Nesterenkonia xinjiangensis]|uniref:DNA-binding HxlR family transcriptional regulator n=1 Tax=Nesterenkonia xinjiangensis TaxID=225327 RepID=A0A7Z0K938_9MICC|nr:helix-turn-helix domain-containing protein [Nesterenkonia xinjiangensis]NYJ76820.1 DNA-binding HxlR family transcriptional regulator [Nesterenkonia xinjiangensis]
MEQPPWNVMVATCPSRTSLARIANKWTAMIVIALSRGRLRFGEIRRAVDGISGKVLADTLRDLERDGIVSRTAYDEMPPRVEYDLTPLGRSLREPLTALGRWAEAHIEKVEAARAAYDEKTMPEEISMR